jgi:hypothetical protein
MRTVEVETNERIVALERGDDTTQQQFDERLDAADSDLTARSAAELDQHLSALLNLVERTLRKVREALARSREAYPSSTTLKEGDA